jgi:hypothetical protein
MREFRRWFTNQFATLAEPFKTKRGNYGVVVTVIASGLIAPVGGLGLFDLRAINQRFRRGFANLKPEHHILGGVDVSFNEEAGSRKPGHYQVHVAFAVLEHAFDASRGGSALVEWVKRKAGARWTRARSWPIRQRH